MVGQSISSLPVTTTDQSKDLSAHRAGQAFTMENCREMADRDPYGEFLAYGLPEKAIGLGFEVMKSEEEDAEVIDDWPEKWKIIEPEWKKIVGPGAGFSRTYGRSVCVIRTSDNPSKQKRPFIRVFEPIQVEEVLYYNDGDIQSITIKDRDPNTGQDIKLEITDKEVDAVFEIINKRKSWFWEAQSYFEPIWDELVGLRLIRSGAVLFAVRVGAGLKIVKIPPNTDPATLAQIKTAAQKLDSLNGWFVLPVEEAEIEIETGTGMVDYDALKQALLGSLAAKTGYPKAAFEGIEMERQGGDFNEERLLDCERVIQRRYKEIAKWLTIHLSDYHGWGITEESFVMRYVRREVVSERQQEEINGLKATTHSTYVNSGVMSADEVRAILGLKGPAPERPNAFGIGVTGLDGKKDDDDQSEEEE